VTNPPVKTTLIIIALSIVVLVTAFFMLAAMSRSGKAAGLAEGHLAKCPDTPNCVCSEYRDDTRHYIDPIINPQGITFEPLPILRDVIRAMGGHIQTGKTDYLAATFSSAIFGFVDDVEIRVDLIHKRIHIRSASRVGYGDFGVNRQRVELLRVLYREKVSETDPVRWPVRPNL